MTVTRAKTDSIAIGSPSQTAVRASGGGGQFPVGPAGQVPHENAIPVGVQELFLIRTGNGFEHAAADNLLIGGLVRTWRELHQISGEIPVSDEYQQTTLELWSSSCGLTTASAHHQRTSDN